MDKLQQRIQGIEEKIQNACLKVGRDRSEVKLVAVTKSVSVGRTQEVIDAGITHLGENRPEGLLHKKQAIKAEPNWHYIGNLQSRKVRDVIDDISYLHSLSRISIAKELQKRASKQLKCFVQVNVSGEDSKSGVAPEELEQFIKEVAIYDKIHIIGLMTMAPNTDDEEIIRSIFKKMSALRDQMSALNYSHAPCTELSMGMSNDYVLAIEEGATYVRIGTALVGKESEEG